MTATPQTPPVGTRLPKPARRRQLLEEAMDETGAHRVSENLLSRGNSLNEFAENDDWDTLQEELEATQNEVKSSMQSHSDQDLVILVSLGGWIRGTQVVSASILQNYDERSAKLLRQPALVSFMQSKVNDVSSDLRNEPAVRDRLDRSTRDCADIISEIIREDAGVSDDQAHLLGMGLVGMAQLSATYWLSTGQMIPKDAAEQLIARLAWRGISGWPRAGEYGGPEHGGAEHGSPEHSGPER